MDSFFWNKIKKGNNDDGGGPGVREDTLHRERVMNIAGQDFVVSTERETTNPDGTVVLQSVENMVEAADGRMLAVTEFVGVSWSGLPVPWDRFYDCIDPFDPPHGGRAVYVGFDGVVTELGNVLCSYCDRRNDPPWWFKAFTLWGVLYSYGRF